MASGGPLRDTPWVGAKNRLLQLIAFHAPGATTVRPWLHRLRGVEVGSGAFIGGDTIIETAFPRLVSIGEDVEIGMRCTIVGHFRGGAEERGRSWSSVRIEDRAFIGPGAIILPNVTVGHGAVVTAGSVVSRSVPPMTMVQGNPATPVARCGVPLANKTPVKEFYRALKPLPRR